MGFGRLSGGVKFMSVFLILALILASLIVFVIVIFFLMTQYKRIMIWVCLVLVTVGFLLYTAGYLSSGEGFANLLLATLRGIFSTARVIFVNDDHNFMVDVQGAQWLTENVWMQILFWLCHVSALVLIQAALISLFGQKLLDNFRLRFGLHSDLYIIIGNDKRALVLGENIATHDNSRKSPDKKRLVVFLLEKGDDEKNTYEKVSHFGAIVKVLDRKADLPYYLKKTGIGKRILRRNKYKIVLMSDNNASISEDAHIIAEFAKEKDVNPECLDIFALTSSEWEREKIEAITLEKEGNQHKYKYTFHIISETDLLVRQMIEKHPPFECPSLNFSETGVAARNFNIMILGFGTVGQTAFLRLIMNGQFVGSRMHAIVIDRGIEHISEHFLHCYPALNLCCDIDFRDFDVRDANFFKLLNEMRDTDYIVVALNDDEENKRTALDIRLHYERKNEVLPFIAVFERDGSLHEVKQDEKIFTFGCREGIYRESIIIREKTDLMAKAVNDTYVKMYGGQPWQELDWFLQESNRAAGDYIPAMLKLARLKENDVLNKEVLTEDNEAAEILAQTEHLRWNAFHVAMGYLPISIDEMRQRFEIYKTEQKPLDLARRDSKARLQVCLVSWDDLDKVNKAYRDLAQIADNNKEQKRDFKDNDRDIVNNIPKFLRTVKGQR
ncbi:MAG: NAD-binding protein [Treponema sp.]|jgi:hypothetical protein|nr:NAD-binding protein [Treponema sp.]